MLGQERTRRSQRELCRTLSSEDRIVKARRVSRAGFIACSCGEFGVSVVLTRRHEQLRVKTLLLSNDFNWPPIEVGLMKRWRPVNCRDIATCPKLRHTPIVLYHISDVIIRGSVLPQEIVSSTSARGYERSKEGQGSRSFRLEIDSPVSSRIVTQPYWEEKTLLEWC